MHAPVTQTPLKKGEIRLKVSKFWIVAFLLPAVLLFSCVYVVSLGILVTTSFTDLTAGGGGNFVGFRNYIQLFKPGSEFLQVIKNNIIWVLLQTTVHILLGVVIAFILARNKWYKDLVRTIYMLPNIIPNAALGMLFLFMLNPKFGMVNSVIRILTGNESFMRNWFMEPKTAFGAVTSTWLPYAGITVILVMSEMTSVSRSVYEAAIIDGASEFQTNIYIILPLMRNIIGTATILAASNMLQKLDIILLTTSGGPGVRTTNMPMSVYQTALIENNYGLANAQGIILILIGLISVLVIRKLYRMNENID